MNLQARLQHASNILCLIACTSLDLAWPAVSGVLTRSEVVSQAKAFPFHTARSNHFQYPGADTESDWCCGMEMVWPVRLGQKGLGS